MKLTAAQIARYTQAPLSNAQMFEQPLNEAMERFEINTPRRVAAFLATVSVESVRLTQLEEGLYYKTPERLREIYPRLFKTIADAAPYVRNPRGLSTVLYDGYHGRGLIQLTWKANYERAGKALGVDYVKTPALVCEPLHAAMTAAWFWSDARCNDPADVGDMTEVTRRVNGPRKLHLVERLAQYASNIDAMEAA